MPDHLPTAMVSGSEYRPIHLDLVRGTSGGSASSAQRLRLSSVNPLHDMVSAEGGERMSWLPVLGWEYEDWSPPVEHVDAGAKAGLELEGTVASIASSNIFRTAE